MADAKRQLLSYLPPEDEQVRLPDCVLVSEDGTELPAHEVFLSMHSRELGKMLAVAKHDDQGSTLLQTQDSTKSLSLLLRELYDSTGAKSVVNADTVLPLLLVADKYDVKAILLRCTMWLNSLKLDSAHSLLATSPVRGADKGANALAWLTVLTRLAEPASVDSFKQLCVEVATADMDWNSSKWAQLPSEVVLAVCQALSARQLAECQALSARQLAECKALSSRHLNELKNRVRTTAKSVSGRLESLPEGIPPKRKQARRVMEMLSGLEGIE